MEESSNSQNFAGVVNLRKTSMASSRHYLAHKRRVRKDSPLRRGSELPLSFRRSSLDRKTYKRKIKVNNVNELKPNMPEVFRITPHTPYTSEEAAEGKTGNSSGSDSTQEENDKGTEKREQKEERIPSTDSQYLKTKSVTSWVTENDQRPTRYSAFEDKEKPFLPQTGLFGEMLKRPSLPRTPFWQTPWFNEEWVDLRDEQRTKSETSQEDESNFANRLKGEPSTTSENYEKDVQGTTENKYVSKIKFTQDLGAVNQEPVFKGTVWNTLRTDVKKVFSDFSTKLLRPPSSDVMHMRPLMRGDQEMFHFGKEDQETSMPTSIVKPVVKHSSSKVVPAGDPEALPINKYVDHSLDRQTVTTPDVTPMEDSTSTTTKSVSRQKRASFPHAAGGHGAPTPCLPGTHWLPSSSPACSRHLLGVLRSITKTRKGQN
ncbi:uncharacterized protein LOC135100306 [Scylla paramamosain]|uniref:uncharacterized protein LOC135100306 n=1 Tax=Scylla paramamosain TaxID=85552 RepID=UPI003082D5ED